MMMLAVMYGMIPRREDREARNAPPENRLNSPRAPPLGALLELVDRQRVDARNPDRGTDPVERDDHEGEQDLVAKILDLEDVLDVREHWRSFLAVVRCEPAG